MKVIIAGDYVPINRVAHQFEKNDFASVLCDVKPIIEKSDYSIINMECPVTESNQKNTNKIGPNLKCSIRGVEALKWAGFNCVTLANNHFLDYGEKGVSDTLSTLRTNGVDYVGGGLNLVEASQILFKVINKKRLAIINCCEHEFSIATSTTGGSNPLNPICQYYAIKEAQEKSDYVLVIVHGGNEHYPLPSPRMIETYRFFIDAGADAVVNHHQHCYSGYEYYKNKPIVYGLGNFCFDDPNYRNVQWNNGYMVMLDFFSDRIGLELIPYEQCSEECTVSVIKHDKEELFKDNINELNAIINTPRKLEASYVKYIKSNCNLRGIFSPYRSRIASVLCNRRLLPSFLSEGKKRLLLAYIQCESHYPKLIEYLR